MTDNTDNGVGFKKPPKRTQFAKGQSGNPNGRPKGSQNFSTILGKACRELVKVTINGRIIKISKFEASMMQLTNKAATGDLKAIRELHCWLQSLENALQPPASATAMNENDQATIASAIERIKRTTSESTEIEANPEGIKSSEEEK